MSYYISVYVIFSIESWNFVLYVKLYFSCCPDRPPVNQMQPLVTGAIPRDVPPMSEIIGAANVMAKHVGGDKQMGGARPGYHYATHIPGPIGAQTVAASIEFDPRGPSRSMIGGAAMQRTRSVDSMSEHIYESYKHRSQGGDSPSMIRESSSAEQLTHMQGMSDTLPSNPVPGTSGSATLPFRTPPPPPPPATAPKPQGYFFPRQHPLTAPPPPPSEAASSITSHPIGSEDTMLMATDRL